MAIASMLPLSVPITSLISRLKPKYERERCGLLMLDNWALSKPLGSSPH